MEKLSCFAVVIPGLEKIVEAELNALSAHDVQVTEAGVSFSGSMDTLCRVNLRARSVTRVLVRLADFKALSFPELYNKSHKIAWERYIPAGVEVQVRAACHHSRLIHSGRVEKAVQDAIAARLSLSGNPAVPGTGDVQQITVRLEHDRCTISIDSSGERLDRRGYRLHSGRAPIRETVAAAILQWMHWESVEPLQVPMCGSGTFAIEAALMGQGRAVNLRHEFAFLHWPMLNNRRWFRLMEKAAGMEKSLPLVIEAADIDPAILQQAISNAEAAGVGGAIRFSQQNVRDLQLATPNATGLIVCNPPYGERIKGDVISLYQYLGSLLQGSPKGWRMAVMVPEKTCETALGLPARRRLKVKHGGKWVQVLHLELD
ncbi:MAG TPA: class I SAM-dependent RNA methyltransferase [Mariprofundaceae bacterium]|nr:class I SAM-dependent RNA methyltransferase [Mariprofundaceae bacterium]